jgi:hypothetical protein
MGVGEWLSRRNVAHLCRRMLSTGTYHDMVPVVRMMCRPPDDWTSATVRRAVVRGCADRQFMTNVLDIIWSVCGVERDRRRYYDLPATVTSFLVTPLPEVPALRADSTRLVEAFLHSVNPRARQDLFDLLSTTSQPHILQALERAFDLGMSYTDNHEQYPHLYSDWWPRLWVDREPAPLMEILLANPHLPIPQDDREQNAELLMLLNDRLDLSDPAAVDTTVRALSLPVPEPVARRCRQWLRELPAGWQRDEVCEQAMTGGVEAIMAALDAGYLPRDEQQVLLFLFCTAQWERYDHADPDGSLLRDYCASHDIDEYRWQIERVAEQATRPDPCPPLPLPLPSIERSGPRSNRGPIGGWPTNPGGFTF